MNNYCEMLYNIIESDFVANCISFLSLVIAVVALIIGGKTVSDILLDFEQKKRNAIFGYHTNLKIYIKRLKRLISDNRSEPMESLYLLSSDSTIREKGAGYELLGERLSDLAQKFLDYLSTESNQIPAMQDYEKWDKLIEQLVQFLSDFLLLGTGSFLPEFDNDISIKEYHSKVIYILDKILELIEQSRKNYKIEVENYDS